MLRVPVVALVEPELAALGGAIQALWALRRGAGEDVSANEVAQKFIALGDKPSQPNPENHRVHVELLQRFEAETRRLYS